MPDIECFQAPNSGQLIGLVVKAFCLDDPEIGGAASSSLNATTQKTTQRFFRGERVDHETSEMLTQQFADALFHSGLLGHMEGTVDGTEGEVGWNAVLRYAVQHACPSWDHEFQQSAAPFPRAHRRLATMVFARQVVIEMALRHASLVMLDLLPEPEEGCPWWATKKGFGAFIEKWRSLEQSRYSGSAIARHLHVDERTVDRWLAGDEVPNLVHVDALARLFATAQATDSEAMVPAFRRAAGLARLAERLRDIVGDNYLERLGEMESRFVRWTLNMADENARGDRYARSLLAGCLTYGTPHPSNVPVLIDWAERVREIPWREDILKSRPPHRFIRLKACLRVIGDAAGIESKIKEALPHRSPEERDALLNCGALRAMSSPHMSPEEVAEVLAGERFMARIPARNPEEAAINRLLQADYAARNNDFHEACSHAARAVHLKPDDAMHRYSFGAFLWQARRWNEAVEQLQHACRLRPDWDRPYVEIAVVYINRGLADMGLHHLEQGPQAMRDASAWYQFVMGKVKWQQKRFDEALQHMERSIAIDSNEGEPFDLAADCAFRMGKHSLGEKYAKEAKHRGKFASYHQWQSGGYPRVRPG